MRGSAAGAVRRPPHSPAGQRSARHVPRVPGAGPARSSGVHRLGSRRERAEFSRLAVYAEQLADGIDPSENRKAMKSARADRATNSFEVVAREWFAKYS